MINDFLAPVKDFWFLSFFWFLFSSADINARDNFKWTALHHACHSGQIDLVQLLLEHGAEMDAQTINGGTPLMRAIESSRESVVEFLISKGYVWNVYLNLDGHVILGSTISEPKGLLIDLSWMERGCD